MAERDTTRPDAAPAARSGLGPWMGVLVFGFGTAAGFLVAFSGLAYLEDGAGLIVLVFLSALFVVALLGATRPQADPAAALRPCGNGDRAPGHAAFSHGRAHDRARCDRRDGCGARGCGARARALRLDHRATLDHRISHRAHRRDGGACGDRAALQAEPAHCRAVRPPARSERADRRTDDASHPGCPTRRGPGWARRSTRPKAMGRRRRGKRFST